MLPQSKTISVVARTVNQDGAVCPELPTKNQGKFPNERAITAYTTANISMAKNCTDSFHFRNNTYLIAVDSFSLFPEVVTLSSTTSKSIILAMKIMFARHGIL